MRRISILLMPLILMFSCCENADETIHYTNSEIQGEWVIDQLLVNDEIFTLLDCADMYTLIFSEDTMQVKRFYGENCDSSYLTTNLFNIKSNFIYFNPINTPDEVGEYQILNLTDSYLRLKIIYSTTGNIEVVTLIKS